MAQKTKSRTHRDFSKKLNIGEGGGVEIVWETISRFCKVNRPTDAVRLSQKLFKVLQKSPRLFHLGSSPRDGSNF
jgi:hypothetical protein